MGRYGNSRVLQWELGGLPSLFDEVKLIKICVTDHSFRYSLAFGPNVFGPNEILTQMHFGQIESFELLTRP